MPRPPFTEFTLDDGHGQPEGPGGTGRRASDPARPAVAPTGPDGWRAALPWVGCAVVLVLIGVLSSPPRPSQVGPWGRVDDLTSAPAAAWSVSPTDGPVQSALIADGMLITVRESDIQGRDPRTGAVVWAQESREARCSTDGAGLLCVDADARVLELDPSSGEVTTRQIPDAVLATRADGDLFVLTGGQRPALQRFSGEHVLWHTPVRLERGDAPFGVELTVLAGHVLTTRATAAEGPVDGHGSAYDARTGAWFSDGAPHSVQAAGPGAWQLMGDGGGQLFVRGADQPQQLAGVPLGYDDVWDGTEQVTVRVAESSGAESSGAAGTGGEAAGAVQTGVLDTDSGEWHWSTEQPMTPVARLDGVLIARTSANDLAATQGRDTATGEVLWQRAEAWLRCPCLADESTLVAIEVGFAPATLTRSAAYEDLIALDAGTGEERWQLDLPGETFAVLSDGEHLIAVAPAAVQGWDLG